MPKATQPYEEKNQPFQTSDSKPLKFDNVFGVPHNMIFLTIILENAGLEELKGDMKSYVSKHNYVI